MKWQGICFWSLAIQSNGSLAMTYVYCTVNFILSEGWLLRHRWWIKQKQPLGCPNSCQNTKEKFGEEVNLQNDWESSSNWTSWCSSQISFISSGFWSCTCGPATTSWLPFQIIGQGWIMLEISISGLRIHRIPHCQSRNDLLMNGT